MSSSRRLCGSAQLSPAWPCPARVIFALADLPGTVALDTFPAIKLGSSSWHTRLTPHSSPQDLLVQQPTVVTHFAACPLPASRDTAPLAMVHPAAKLRDFAKISEAYVAASARLLRACGLCLLYWSSVTTLIQREDVRSGSWPKANQPGAMSSMGTTQKLRTKPCRPGRGVSAAPSQPPSFACNVPHYSEDRSSESLQLWKARGP